MSKDDDIQQIRFNGIISLTSTFTNEYIWHKKGTQYVVIKETGLDNFFGISGEDRKYFGKTDAFILRYGIWYGIRYGIRVVFGVGETVRRNRNNSKTKKDDSDHKHAMVHRGQISSHLMGFIDNSSANGLLSAQFFDCLVCLLIDRGSVQMR